MPSYRTGVVTDVVAERDGLQRVLVDHDQPAYVLTDLVGHVEVGDFVIVNTTAVELGLGTGGEHVVHWNLSRNTWNSEAPGHVMKLRYSSLQTDVAAVGSDLSSLDEMPVIVCGLHSQLPAAAVAFKAVAAERRNRRLAYVMTDAGALPLALSDLVYELRARNLIDLTITTGHAFGGDVEAVSIYDALALACEHADAVVVAMGPGSVGTGTTLGFSGIEVGACLDAAASLGGVPIAAVRASATDPRERHRGISHHTVTALTIATHTRVVVAIPEGLALDAEIEARHDIVRVLECGIVGQMAAAGLAVTSMGRPAAEDPLFFECAAAAGTVAAQRLP
jgi:hypothetical protein